MQIYKELFNDSGEINSTNIDPGRSRGFGFVEMAKEVGQRAIEKFSGHVIDNRSLCVNEANEMQPRSA